MQNLKLPDETILHKWHVNNTKQVKTKKQLENSVKHVERVAKPWQKHAFSHISKVNKVNRITANDMEQRSLRIGFWWSNGLRNAIVAARPF